MSDKSEKQYDEEGRVIRPNRSQLKREREQIKQFAAELLRLPAGQFGLLPVDERLQEALREGQRLSGNARACHFIFLTRLIDEQGFEAIRTAHEHINHPFLNDPGKTRRIQREMERLLAGDPNIFNELLERYEELDIQYLRQLQREHHKQFKPELGENQLFSKQQRQLQKYLAGLRLRPHD